MGTTNNPGAYDCHASALPDEPKFTILGRDPDFQRLVSEWAARRHLMVMCGERPDSDMAAVMEAYSVAVEGAKWRKENNGAWRKAS
jgi:hypothetical protein